MKSLQELCKQCVAVCNVPVTANKDSICIQVQRNLHDGGIIDSDRVLERDKNFTRLILLLATVKDVKRLCEEVRKEEMKFDGDQSFVVKYHTALACELPERWESAEIQEKLLKKSTSGTQHNRQVPTLLGRSDETKSLKKNPYQIPYHPVFGFYQNIPTDAVDGRRLAQEGRGPYLLQSQMPQPLQMQGLPYNQGDSSGHGGDNEVFFGLPGFEGQEHISDQQVPKFKHSGIGGPMVFDPQPGQFYPLFPVTQPTKEVTRSSERQQQPQWPTGPTMAYNRSEFQNQVQEWFVNDEPDEDVTGQQETETNEKPTKLLVSNLPSKAHEEFLEMFFENPKRSGGGPVVSVDYDEESASAIIEFEEPKAVVNVLEKQPLKMMGWKILVDVFDPEPISSCTIEVTGPHNLVCEEQMEILQMYFEHKKSLGDEVKDIVFDGGVALVTFHSEEVARRVAQKSDHKINKIPINVNLHIPESKVQKLRLDRQSFETSSDELIDKPEEEENEPVVTVKVKGVKALPSRDTVKYYFANKRRSGGFDLQEVISDEEDDDVLYLKYQSEEVARAVAERNHQFEGVRLTASLFTHPKLPPSYPNKILIKGLKPVTTEDGLFNFIEAKSGYIPVPGSMTYHAEKEDVVMVTLDREPDFEKMEKMCEERLDDGKLKISKVPISNCIIVSHLAPDVTKDTVKFYFENKRKSNGGPVSKVVMNDDDTCFVYFEDYRVVDSVLEKEHELSKQKLEVKRYQECLGRPEGELGERKLNIPEVEQWNEEETAENVYETIPADKSNFKVMARCKAYDCRNIYAAVGDMTEMSVQVLVNAADEKLSLSGGLAKAIASKGGRTVVRACADYIRMKGKLDDGEVFMCTGGNLKTDYIIHVIEPVWRGGMMKGEDMLREVVLKCMQKASVENAKSIAIPAIGCGAYGYPVKYATSTIVKAVKNFFREVRKSPLTDVYLCDLKQNVVDKFTEALHTEFGDIKNEDGDSCHTHDQKPVKSLILASKLSKLQ